MPMLAISDEGVDLSIGDAKVRTLRVGTSETLGVHVLGGSPPAFHLAPGTRHPQALHPMRQWSPDDRRGNRLGSGAGGVDGACCAWPFLVRRKTEDGTSQDAKAAPERAGGKPRTGTRTHKGPSESSLFEMGNIVSSLRSKDKESLLCCQANGRAVRIIHHRETLDPLQAKDPQVFSDFVLNRENRKKPRNITLFLSKRKDLTGMKLAAKTGGLTGRFRSSTIPHKKT